jgi:hypothetical protein
MKDELEMLLSPSISCLRPESLRLGNYPVKLPLFMSLAILSVSIGNNSSRKRTILKGFQQTVSLPVIMTSMPTWLSVSLSSSLL